MKYTPVFSIITKKLKLILSEKKLNKLGKETEFTKRERNVTVFQLVTAMICALGDKNTEYLSDILRYFNRLTDQNVRYKPFHNRLAKPELADLMRQVTEKVFTHWINNVLQYKKGHFSQFKKVFIQDGSSFSVKESLKNIWPGRFTKTSPAAIEFHAVINLKNGGFESASITPDTFLISTTLKRFVTGCIEQIFKVEMSTMIVSKTTVNCWYGLLEAIVQQRRKGLANQITEACEFLKENAQRAHPKRDRQSGILQYALEPAFHAGI